MGIELSQNQFIADLKQRVLSVVQYKTLKAVNTQLINIYWEIRKSLSEKQSENWSKSVVPKLSVALQKEFLGISGFYASNYCAMAQFYQEYHNLKIPQPLVGEISWSKRIIVLNKCKNNEERQFYKSTTQY